MNRGSRRIAIGIRVDVGRRALLSTLDSVRQHTPSSSEILLMTGFSELIGSWKTIAMSAPQSRRISLSESPMRSRPMAFYRGLAAAMAADSTCVKRYGDTCRRAGSNHEALEYYSRSIQIDPTNAWAWFDKGLTLKALGACDEALAAVLEADRLLHPQDGNRTWVHTELGTLYVQLGRDDLARPQFQTAIRLQPGNVTARQALIALRG